MIRVGLPLLALGWGLGGCLPTADTPLDEQKEPYYLAGQRRLSAFDFKGAAESFEKALEANPRSAAAHFQLGVLYEQKLSEENSFAVAIYHYHRFLQLRPNSEYAEIVRQRIIGCKQELAKPIALAPGTQSLLRDFERLKVENAQLKSQLEAWAAFATNRAHLPAPPPAPLPPRVGESPAPAPVVPPRATPPPAARTHKVQPGETPATIARKYNVPLQALMDANPGLDARRLQIDQVINIPAP